jgi:transposase
LRISGQSSRRVEVLAGPERRRRWSWEEKARIVAESLAPDAVASSIARRHGLHPNQLYAWRKELRAAAGGAGAGVAPAGFVPVEVAEDAPAACTCGIEIELAGARVRVPPRADSALLVHVLRTLKALG